MGVSLYTVRVVLNTLGVEDFGIYHAVAGFVALFTFLSSAMTSASQRYFSYALGQGDDFLIESVFSVNVLIYGAIALFALLALETMGLWFIYNHLEVPEARFDGAVVAFHLSALALVATVLMAPFNAMIIAHEDMHLFAYLSILDAFIRLIAVSLLPFLVGDKIVLYAALMLGVSWLMTFGYFVVCKKRYAECQFGRFHFDRSLAKEMIEFTGWTLYGTLTTVGRNQAVTVLLNQFFNPVVVAARVIAVSLASKAILLSQNFNVGLYPPIIKSYAAGEMREMHELIFNGSKITFFLMWVLALPLFLEMEALLLLWLGEAPPYAVVFTRLALMETLIMAISHPLANAARAPGKMALYEGTLGTMQLMVFLGAWCVLALGAPPQAVFFVAIAVNVLMFFARLWIVKRLVGVSALVFFKRVLGPVSIVVFLTALPSTFVHLRSPDGLLGQGVSVFFCLLLTFAVVYALGLEREWRLKLNDFIASRYRRLFFRI